MKISELLKEADAGFEKMMKNVIKNPKAGKHEVSMRQAFGSEEDNFLGTRGINFMEKPDYWGDLDHAEGDYKPIKAAALEKAEQAMGTPFKIYTQDKIFTGRLSKDKESKDGYMPQSDAKLPKENVFIVHMKDGTRYLADGTQARSYIRMWAKIVD